MASEGQHSQGGNGAGVQRRSPRTLAARVEFVRDLAERLTGVSDLDELGTTVSSELRVGLGASAVVVNLVSDDDAATFTTLVADGVTGQSGEQLEAPTPVAGSVPAAAVLERARPLLLGSTAARDREFPRYKAMSSASASWAVLPLIVQGRAIGTLSIGWATPRRFGRVEAAILELTAHQCALAIDRTRLDRARRIERETLELLSEGTRLMVSTLEPEHVIAALVHLAVPRLAPWCAVFVPEQGVLRPVAIEIGIEDEAASRLRQVPDVPVDAPLPVARAFRTGKPQVAFPVSAEIIRLTYPSDAERLLETGASWTGFSVPVRAAGSVVGVMTLVSPEWAGVLPDEVRFAAEGLAGRAGVALGNARRYKDERETAAMLMEAFLPAKLPFLPGYDVAARYLPAGSRVAGDWYDVVQLPDGRFLVGIGDAGGHGISAAALMGQLRNGARALAMTGRRPSEILAGLHLLAVTDSEDSFATATYGLLDPKEDTFVWAAAGHVPPLRYSGATAQFLNDTTYPPLGWPSVAAADRALHFDTGDGLVLVTDGVVERRKLPVADGMEALRQLVADNSTLSSRRLTQLVVERLCATPEDDCCVLVLRRH